MILKWLKERKKRRLQTIYTGKMARLESTLGVIKSYPSVPSYLIDEYLDLVEEIAKLKEQLESI